MSSDNDDTTDKVVSLEDWRIKNNKPQPKSIWVSSTDPKVIVKLDHNDLSVNFVCYDESLKKVFFKNFSIIEITSLFKSIQDEYTKYQK